MKKNTLLCAIVAAMLLLSACSSAETEQPEVQKEYVPYETVTYKGHDNQIIEIEPWKDDTWVLHVTGNRNEGFFCVTGYDKSNKQTELFVNTTKYYDGYTIDLSQNTVYLDIESSDNWTVELVSISKMHSMEKGEQLDGNGDAVLFIYSYGDTVSIYGNAEKAYFGVVAYGSDRNDLWVNTTDQCQETVRIKNDVCIVSVFAEGKWRIKLN